MKLIYTKAARTDLEAIFDYLAVEATIKVADRMVETSFAPVKTSDCFPHWAPGAQSLTITA